MKILYKLEHKHLIKTNLEIREKVYDTKVLGFFSSEEHCKNMIMYYLQQPGFKDFPNGFVIEQIGANIDVFSDSDDAFDSSVFYLSHEYYDGEFDYISNLGYYSSYSLAQKKQSEYQLEPEYANCLDGFCIDEYEIDKAEWTEGFFVWDN